MSAHNYNPTAADKLLQQINRSTDVFDFVESDEDSSEKSGNSSPCLSTEKVSVFIVLLKFV